METSKRLEIERLFADRGTTGLREVVDAFGGTVSFEEAGIVRAALRASGDV